MARPKVWTDAKRKQAYTVICERLVDGESLRSICSDKDMPAMSTVLVWLGDDALFAAQYARARENQADTLADEILEIADDARNDWMERNGQDDAGWQANGEHIQRSKLRVDARRWAASKLAPKKYGDRLDMSVKASVETMTDEQIEAKLKALLAAKEA